MSARSLILATVCLALGLVSTGQTGEPPRNAPARLSPQQLDAYTWISGCLDPKADQVVTPTAGLDCDGIVLSTTDSSVVMSHFGAMLNCCTDISMAVRLEDDTIRFREQETGDYCDCICTYDLAAELNGIEPGQYQVEVWSAGGLLLCTQTVEVVPTAPPLSYTASDCLDPEPPLGVPGDEPETVEIIARGSDIHVEHHNALLSCCSELTFDLAEEPGVFRLIRSEHGAELCNCLCHLDITVLIHDVSPGTYLVELLNDKGRLIANGTVTVPGPEP